MADVTISNIAGGEDTSPARTSKLEIEVGGVSKFAQLVNILKNAIPIGGTTPAAGAFTTLKQTTGKAAGAIPVSDVNGALTLTASTGSGAPVRATSPTLVTPVLGTPSSGDLSSCTGKAAIGANSDITSILNAALYLGRDADNKINFGTDDHLKVTIAGVEYDLTTVLVPATPVAIGETTPNTIRGLNKEVYKVNTAASPLTAVECSGTIVSNYGMTDAGCAITLPAAAEGLAFVCILPAVRAQYFRLNAGAGDKIYLNGVAGTDAEYIGVASGYATGTSVSMFCFKASDGSFDWMAIPLFGSWVAE